MTAYMSAKRMDFCMVTACHYSEISWVIIQFVPINVMNYFRTGKPSAYNPFHYFPVLQNYFSVFCVAAIALSVYVANPFWMVFAKIKRNITFSRAEKPLVIFSPTVCLPIGSFAIKANVIFPPVIFFRATISAEKPILCTRIENGFAMLANARKRLASSVIFIKLQQFFNCHLVFPLKTIGAAVVHECLSIHSDPINRKRPGFFVNTYSLA